MNDAYYVLFSPEPEVSISYEIKKIVSEDPTVYINGSLSDVDGIKILNIKIYPGGQLNRPVYQEEVNKLISLIIYHKFGCFFCHYYIEKQ